MKNIKQKARQSFYDQRSQDNEGGVPCGLSYIAGYLAAFHELVKLKEERIQELEQALLESKSKEELI